MRGGLLPSPVPGDLFIFFNKRRSQVKLLIGDIEGYLIFHERLGKGRLEIPAFLKEPEAVISDDQL